MTPKNRKRQKIYRLIDLLIWLAIVLTAFGDRPFGIATLKTNALSQIIPDDTLGDESSIVVPDQNINDLPSDLIEGGAQRGENLFHSFSQFSIEAGQGAYFNNPGGIANIFSRVTGNNVSNILGTLGINGDADLFFINPNGIIFGENASLDVNGSFLATTANSVVFANDIEFSATNPEALPILTIDIPTGLQYGSNPQRIVNTSVTDGVGLQVLSGENISLLGGEVNLDRGLITAPGGTVELSGISAAGEISIAENGSFSFPSEVAKADVSLINGAEVNVRENGGGFINVNAQNLLLSGQSRLFAGIAENGGATDAQAGDITINANDSVRLIGDNTEVIGLDTEINNHVGFAAARRDNPDAQSNAIGNGGSILVNTKLLEISDQARITANSFATGNAGNIIINSQNIVLNSETIASLVVQGTGDAGNVVINNTETMVIGQNASILSQVNNDGIGNAGNIEIETGSLTLQELSLVTAGNEGTGDGGNIKINAQDSVVLTQNSIIQSQVIDGGRGNAGDIEIETDSLTLQENALILADNQEQGNSGNITINAQDSISLDGQSLIISQIQQDVEGNAGDINLTASKLTLNDFSLISTNVKEESIGKTGNISIDVNTLSLNNGSVIDALTESNFGGGDINVNASFVNLNNGGKIVTSGSGGGNAGSLNFNINDTLVIDNNNPAVESPFEESSLQDLASETGLFASTVGDSTGDGGNIRIIAGSIQLQNGGFLSASTSSGLGGNINLRLDDTLSLQGDSLISAEAGSIGNGGNIDIDTELLAAFPPEGANGNDIIANAVAGEGGFIQIAAEGIFGLEIRAQLTEFNDITAFSQQNTQLDGTIEINTPDITQNIGLLQLPDNLVSTQVTQTCQRGDSQQPNEFVVTGRGSLPNSPEANLESDFGLEDWRAVKTEDSTSVFRANENLLEDDLEQSEPIVEASNWIINNRGKVVLTAKAISDQSGDIPSFHPQTCQLQK